MAMQGPAATETKTSSLVSRHCEFVLRSRGAAIKEHVPCDAACHICVAKTAVLNRIKAAGGDVVKALEDSALRAVGEVCVVRAVPLDRALPSWRDRIKTEDLEADPTGSLKKVIRVPWEPASRAAETVMVQMKMKREVPAAKGVVKNTIEVLHDYIDMLLTGPPGHKPILPLSEKYFQKKPHLREAYLAAAIATLRNITEDENIMIQYFDKGYAMLEVEVDYD